MSEPAGWYANPDGTDSERYWDGGRWTHDVRPLPGQLLQPPPQPGVGTPEPPIDPGGPNMEVPAGPEVESGDRGPRPSGAVSDLFGLLFDLSFRKPLTRSVAETIYRVAVMATIVVIVLMVALGILAGGVGAFISLVLWPVVGLLSLAHLRAVLQAAVGAEPTADLTGQAGQVDASGSIDLSGQAGRTGSIDLGGHAGRVDLSVPTPVDPTVTQQAEGYR